MSISKTAWYIIFFVCLAGTCPIVKLSVFPTERSKTVRAEILLRQYEEDLASADKLYKDKLINVEGKLLEIIVLDDHQSIIFLKTSSRYFHVQCHMKMNFTPHVLPEIGSAVQVSGICKGKVVDIVITDGVLVSSNRSKRLSGYAGPNLKDHFFKLNRMSNLLNFSANH